MSLQSYVFDLISGDTVMRNLAFNENKIHLNHTVDTPQDRPMIVLRWQAVSAGIGPVNQRVLQVWVHDVPGNYQRINEALKRLRTILTRVQGVNVGDATDWITSIRWEGDSDDLRDDEAGTFTRNAQFRITGSAA